MASTLKAGESLAIGQSLVSQNGRFRLNMQADGNLVLYDGSPAVSGAVWSTGTYGYATWMQPTHVDMQANGDLVLKSMAGVPLWASDSAGKGGTHLDLQDDRNLVLYKDDMTPVWASHTRITPQQVVHGDSGRRELGFAHWGRSRATMYRNGLLVVDTELHNDAWFFGFKAEGFVVPVDNEGRAIWVSQLFQPATICGVTDPECASNLTHNYAEHLPAEVGAEVQGLDIYLANVPQFGDMDLMRQQVIDAIKAAGEIAGAIMGIIATLA
jgi:hypothetical protein